MSYQLKSEKEGRQKILIVNFRDIILILPETYKLRHPWLFLCFNELKLLIRFELQMSGISVEKSYVDCALQIYKWHSCNIVIIALLISKKIF